jgi:tRNA dimethylallyltransferase
VRPTLEGIAILGPTGSGKSDLAMRLAQEMPVEIISVDSAQVYRGLDIGTAKPTAAQRAAVPHHLIDIRDPEQVYSAGEFREDCLRVITEIRSRGAVPVLVGGTMLYFRSLFRGIASLPTADNSLRKSIDHRARIEGWPALHTQLVHLDPAAAARINPNDAQRIQRALEVVTLSGRTLKQHWDQPSPLSVFDDWRIGLLVPTERAQLHERLASRLNSMFDAGLVNEVRGLVARGTLELASPVLRLVGYRQLIDYCRGVEPLERAKERVLFASRQLAKRQLTWLRSDNLLPSGAKPLQIDPFCHEHMERLVAALIKSGSTP